jgi:hypothetical protein
MKQSVHSLNVLGLVVFAGASLIACGGHPLDPGAGNDPGTGTATIVANGTVAAHARVPNSTLPTDFTTDFSIRLSINNTPVTTGTVTISSRTASIPLTWNNNGGGGNNGRWEASGAVYDEVYQLDVVSGPDKITGVRVDGPDIHAFTAPLAGGSVDSTIATPLAWSREVKANIATLSINDGNTNDLTIDDTGTYSIAPASFKAEKDKTRPNRIVLVRTNHLAPGGAAAGSDFKVSVEQDLDVVVLANPNAP